MKKVIFFLVLTSCLSVACNKEEALPPTDYIMVKFINKTGKDIQNLIVNRMDIGELKKGKTTSTYYQYEALGEQYGYALVETVATIDGTRFFTSSACQGVCGTASAPDGEWLTPGYYKIAVAISGELGGNYLEFRMFD
ncbi:MAG TPA: hypothetical protein ENJ20_04980 [Bacteroidetes bacterium]|nr:hypothetical protein [Bacteroidota bacterium]